MVSKIKCPGQDTRFWRPEDIFEVECGECGRALEFFKDDAYRRCPTCGRRITNPKLSLGCAQWCQYAKECLGYDPKELLDELAEEASLGDQLIAAMKAEFDGDQPRITHALLVLERAEQILRVEGGDPRVVVAAAVLHDIGIKEAERKHGSSAGCYQELEGPPTARRLMKGLDLDVETTEHVCCIVGSHHSGDRVDALEFRIIWDADWLVNLAAQAAQKDEARLRETIEQAFRTKTGKEIAYRLFFGTFGERPAVAEKAKTERSEA